VVEDVVDTGHTLARLLGLLRLREPRSLELCALLDKPDRREVAVSIDYLGFSIPDRFVVGYGLDHAERWRNLPYVGIVDV
jgi:hypoxanthine phosphoribosyltransferase